MHSKTMLGFFNPLLGQIWTNPIVGLKKKMQMGLSIFDPKLG